MSKPVWDEARAEFEQRFPAAGLRAAWEAKHAPLDADSPPREQIDDLLDGVAASGLELHLDHPEEVMAAAAVAVVLGESAEKVARDNGVGGSRA